MRGASVSAATPLELPCRHLRQNLADNSCLDCGHRWRLRPQERARIAVLGAILREQEETALGTWRWYTAILVSLLARLAVAERHARAVDRVTDELVAFQVRYDAGDKLGAALALRAWIARFS